MSLLSLYRLLVTAFVPIVLSTSPIVLSAEPALATPTPVGEYRASGSAATPDHLVGIEARLSERSVREDIALGYDIASDDAVAARGGATVFKTGHYAERLAKEGVDVVRAEKAVAERIGVMRPNMSTGAEVRGRFELDGVLLEYRAYPLPNGSVNVGTIFPVKP